LAADKNAPRELTVRLAGDDIRVARPILENSPNLTSQDLVALARDQGKDHRLAISKRDDLDEDVTDALIEQGELEVLRAVSGNHKARISDWGFGSLARHAPNDDAIQDNLSRRRDMSLEAAKSVLPLLAPNAQRLLISMMQDESGELTKIISKAARDTSKKKIGIAKKRLGAKAMISSIRRAERSLGEVIVMLSEENRPMDCALVLAVFSGIPEDQAANALLQVNSETISLLCKSLDIERPHFRALCSMRCQRLHLPLSQADRLAERYDDIDPAVAKRTMRFLKVRNAVKAGSDAA
ncbi:MAG TPA: DUF2336 domain-containing protein, partial [Rhizobiales bacterium]|nr:DUF2336 domain-containing protein [Hyphomicrobiales bacterium]